MNGIAPDKSAALLLCYDTPTSEVAAKGIKSITSNYMLPPVKMSGCRGLLGWPKRRKPTDSEVRESALFGETMNNSPVYGLARDGVSGKIVGYVLVRIGAQES